MFALSNRVKKGQREELVGGVRQAATWLLGLGWVVLAGSGAMIAFSETQHAKSLGWAELMIAGVIAVLTMDIWVRALPVILGMAILSGSLSVWNGYAGTNPGLRIQRLSGAITLLILIACNVLAISLSSRKLTRVDRVALVAFLIFFGIAFATFPSAIGFGLMFCSLAAAWVYDRFKGHSPPSPGDIRGKVHRDL